MSYASIEGSQRPRTSLHWHVLAFFTPWMLLGGFLTLPHLFDGDGQQLRTSDTAIRVLATLSITSGFASTMLLASLGPTWSFVLLNVFLPAFSASCLALLSFIFLFVISSRYTWNYNAIISTSFAIFFFAFFASAALYAHRKVVQEQRMQDPSNWQRPMTLSLPRPRFSTIWNRITRRDTSSLNLEPAYQEAPVEIIPRRPDSNVEAQRNQFQGLLRSGRIEHIAAENPNQHSTYHVDLPNDDEELEEPIEAGEAPQSYRQSTRRSFRASSSTRTRTRPIMGNIDETISGGNNRGVSQSRSPPPPERAARRGVTFDDRNTSRETRRREIELGRWA